jgi:tetratricopeptide (TPR) repeat protein
MLVILFGSEERVPWKDVWDTKCLLSKLKTAVLAPQEISDVAACLDSILECADKAVALAPDAKAPYQWRFVFKLHALRWRKALCSWRGAPFDAAAEAARLDLLTDGEAMARLCPEDPDLLGNLAATYLLNAISSGAGDQLANQRSASGKIQDALPAAATKNILAIMSQLKTLTNHQQPQIAEVACRRLALFHMLMGNFSEAERLAQHALTLQPASEASWDILWNCKFQAVNDDKEKWDQAFPILKKQLECLPTARNYRLLAKAYASEERLEEAEKLLRTALDRFPEDTPSRLGLIAVLLLQGNSPTTLDEVKQHLIQASRQLTYQERDTTNRANYNFSRAIYEAILGHIPASHDIFLNLERSAPSPDRAKKALELFSY